MGIATATAGQGSQRTPLSACRGKGIATATASESSEAAQRVPIADTADAAVVACHDGRK
jgi:hypothetical protein